MEGMGQEPRNAEVIVRGKQEESEHSISSRRRKRRGRRRDNRNGGEVMREGNHEYN